MRWRKDLEIDEKIGKSIEVRKKTQANLEKSYNLVEKGMMAVGDFLMGKD